MENSEIILYQPENSLQLEVRMENETVWLNRQQIALLFDRDVKTIGKHINNALKEELQGLSTVANFATVQKEGNRQVERLLEYYNIEVITSVGYRVKSQRGVQFRIWANRILKDYLLKGYAFNQRIERLEHRVFNLEEKTADFDLVIKTSLPPKEGVFFNGQVFDAFCFVSDLIKSSKSHILLIDNYIDEKILQLISGKHSDVKVDIYTKTISHTLQLAINQFNAQYGNLNVKPFTLSHDRFLIIDNKEIYLIGASLKDLGKKWFAFSTLDPNNITEIKKRLP